MLGSVSERPPHLGSIGFGPPAVEFGEIQSAIDENFHAAGAAGFPGTARSIDPDIHALDEVLGEVEVVVFEEDGAALDIGTGHEMDPLAQQGLAGEVARMGFTGDDELHGAVGVGEDAREARGIVEEQSGAFVGGEPAGKAEGQNVGIEEGVRGRVGGTVLMAAAHFENEGGARGSTHAPDLFVGGGAEVFGEIFQFAAPPAAAADGGPQFVGPARIPCRNMDAVGDVLDGDLILGPTREQGLEQHTADGSVKAADAVDGSAAADGEVGHVEIRAAVSPKAQHLIEGDAEGFLRVAGEVAAHQIGREDIESGGDGGMGGEQVAGAGDGEGDIERLSGSGAEGGRSLQDGESGMSFIEVADFGLKADGLQEAPAADAESDLLLQPEFKTGSIEFTGDAAGGGGVGGIIAIEQVEADAPHPHLPGAENEREGGKLHRDADPFAGLVSHGADGQLSRIVVGVKRALIAAGVDCLAEIAALVQESDSDDGHAHVAGGLELISGHVAESAGVDGEGFAESVLHGEIGDGGERGVGMRVREPGGGIVDVPPLLKGGSQAFLKDGIGGDGLEAGTRFGLQDEPGVMGGLP